MEVVGLALGLGAAIGLLRLSPVVVSLIDELRSAGETFAGIAAELQECQLILDHLSTELYQGSIYDGEDYESVMTYLYGPNGPVNKLNGLVEELRRRVASQNSENQTSSRPNYQPRDMDDLHRWVRSVKSSLGLLLSEVGSKRIRESMGQGPPSSGIMIEATAEPPGAQETLQSERRSAALRRAVEALSRVNDDLQVDIARQSQLEIEDGSAGSTSGTFWHFRCQIEPCYLIGAAIFVVFTVSLVVSLWWSISRQDVSGGFTVGAYMVAALSLPIGFVSYRHWERCRCTVWR